MQFGTIPVIAIAITAQNGFWMRLKDCFGLVPILTLNRFIEVDMELCM
jgi:hypothetical protein